MKYILQISSILILLFTTTVHRSEARNSVGMGKVSPKAVDDTIHMLFKKVQKYVIEGRLELGGGMWTEGDTNLSSGEAPDGSKILCYSNDTYNGKITEDLKNDLLKFSPDNHRILHITGVGDHGGGPTRKKD